MVFVEGSIGKRSFLLINFMSRQSLQASGFFSYLQLIRQALRGEERDHTAGSLKLAIFMLAVPMILEMFMESIFAVVDIYFVSRLGKEAVSTVILTESFLTILYSAAVAFSVGATAIFPGGLVKKILKKQLGQEHRPLILD